jgi:hypothetical protein
VHSYLNDYINQEPFKTRHKNDRCLHGSISGLTLDISKAVTVLSPDKLSDVTIFIPKRDKIKRLVGTTVIYTSLNTIPERVEDLINFFNTADSSKFEIIVTDFNFSGIDLRSYIPFYYEDTLNFEGGSSPDERNPSLYLSQDEQNPLLYLAYGKKQLISLQKI